MLSFPSSKKTERAAWGVDEGGSPTGALSGRTPPATGRQARAMSSHGQASTLSAAVPCRAQHDFPLEFCSGGDNPSLFLPVLVSRVPLCALGKFPL